MDDSRTKLSAIDARSFAESVGQRVIDHHITRLKFDAGADIEVNVRVHPSSWQGTSVGLAAHQLCHYAQTGEPPEHRPELIPEYLQTYCEALYTRPGDAAGYDVPPLDQVDGEPQEPHEIVLVAAVARDLIDRGEPVSLLQLAVLAEVSYQYTRTLASRGEIQTSGQRGPGAAGVSADEARRWLGARGVAGYR